MRGITRVIREVGKLNLANFDVAMLCAVGGEISLFDVSTHKGCFLYL